MPSLRFGITLPFMDSSLPIIEYSLAAIATIVVLLVVCWPAKRRED